MGAFFVYILKSSLCLAVFYLFYRLLLSKETFHRCNRIALLSIILLSYILPLATITTNQHTMVSTAVTTVEDLLIMYEQNVVPNQGLQPEFGFPWQEILIICYVAGAIFSFFATSGRWGACSISSVTISASNSPMERF